MNYTKKIKELKNQINKLQIAQSNHVMEGMIKKFVNDRIIGATNAEKMFLDICKKKKLNLEFQYPIRILDKKGKIKKFFIVDFCDKKHNIIIEVDGEYHTDPVQRNKDNTRTKVLKKLGYRVYRISNVDVYEGKSTQFLYNIYKNKIV